MKMTIYVTKQRVFPSRSEVVISGAELGYDPKQAASRVELIETYSDYSAVVKAQAFEVELPEEKVKEIVEYFNQFPAFDEQGKMIFYNKKPPETP